MMCPAVRLVSTLAMIAVSGGQAPTALAGACGVPPSVADDRPNFLIVLTDDQGYGDLNHHGNDQIRTPTLDRFFREGIEFTRFYCSPVCAPTRASLLTGRYYYRTGVIHTSRGGAKMHGDEVTLAERLRGAGYRTGLFGKWHLGDNSPMRPQDQGFEEVLAHRGGGIGQTPDKPNPYQDPWLWHNGKRVRSEGYCTDVFCSAAIDFLQQEDSRPFLAYVSLNAPHTPLEVAEDKWRPYQQQGLNETTARIHAMVENIDENFGRLLGALDAAGLRERTVVLFLTDNGPQQRRFNADLRGRKSQVYEGGIRVPCAWQWPGRWTGGRTVSSIAAHIDVLPTVCRLAGVPSGEAVDGIDLEPLLTGRRSTPSTNRSLFFQCHRGLEPQRYRNCAVVSQRFKLVGGPGTFSQPAVESAEPPVLELYDLQSDPSESTNLANVEPAQVAQMQEQYEHWFSGVQATRQFDPGVIEIGTDAENPIHLCRYQDATYVDGAPHGWSVKIVRGGRYRVRVTAVEDRPGEVSVKWQNETQRHHGSVAEFRLAAGRGQLDIWFQPAGADRERIRDNGTAGDVLLEYLD